MRSNDTQFNNSRFWQRATEGCSIGFWLTTQKILTIAFTANGIRKQRLQDVPLSGLENLRIVPQDIGNPSIIDKEGALSLEKSRIPSKNAVAKPNHTKPENLI